ncbi:MAG: hypothetical protein RLZZ514_1192 [Actinomycetota bacterium]
MALASLIAWPVTGILTSLVFEPLPPLDSEKYDFWTAIFGWAWKNLLAVPLYGSAFLGHFVFAGGLFLLAELTKSRHPGRKATLVAVASLFAGVLLKAASYIVFLPDTWGIGLFLADSLVAIFVIFLTASLARKSSLLLEK